MQEKYEESLKVLRQRNSLYYSKILEIGGMYVEQTVVGQAEKDCSGAYGRTWESADKTFDKLVVAVNEANQVLPVDKHIPKERGVLEELVGDLIFDIFKKRRRDMR